MRKSFQRPQVSHSPRLLPFLLLLLPLRPACRELQGVANPVEVLAPPGDYFRAQPGGERALTVRLAPGAEGARVFLRMADPCALGTASCPGWDPTRYPGVEHTQETFALSPSSPEATFRFRVAPEALPQGPFKWEVVAQDPTGREWTRPLYLRILREGDEEPLQAINRWRTLVGVNPAGDEDLERGFQCWQYGRYAVKNEDNPDYPHTTDPRKPFWTPGADACARTSHTGAANRSYRSARPLPENFLAEVLSLFINIPIHRLPWLAQYASPPTLWAGMYVERRDWDGYPGGVAYKVRVGTNVAGNSPIPREVLFPPPGSSVPYPRMFREWPNPVEACNATAGPPSLPYRSLQATWQHPMGMAITVTTSAPRQAVDTEATYARLVRTRDGVELPVCALGSRQFWNADPGATNTAVWFLRNYGTIIVLPKDPLDPGEEYEVEVRGLFGGQERAYKWRFRVSQNPAY